MSIADKTAAAQKINQFLAGIINHGGFRLKYRISVDPPPPNEWDNPEILVEFAGPDSPLLLEHGAEVLRSIEQLTLEAIHAGQDDHDKVLFDCKGFRSARVAELRMLAEVAATKVRESQEPFHFVPMSSRERRLVHLALKQEEDLRTESEGEARERHVVVCPKDYVAPASGSSTRNRRFQMLN